MGSESDVFMSSSDSLTFKYPTTQPHAHECTLSKALVGSDAESSDDEESRMSSALDLETIAQFRPAAKGYFAENFLK